MKLRICSVVLISLFIMASSATATQPSGTLQSMKLLTSQVGWAADAENLFWTTDGGSHWKDITPRTSAKEAIADVFFLDTSNGWALLARGDDNDEAQFDEASTKDGGATWFVSHVKIPNRIADEFSGRASIYFLDPLHGWMNLVMTSSSAFRPGKLLATQDGGKTWNHEPGDSGAGGSVCFFDGQDGLLTGGPENTELYITHDASRTWQTLSLKAPLQASSADFPTYGSPICEDSKHGFLPVTYSGPEGMSSALVLFASADGGHTWKPDRVVPNVAETSPGQRIAAAVTGSVLITLTVSNGTSLTLTTLPPKARASSTRTQIDGEAFAVLQASFVNAPQGWVLTSNGLFSTLNGGVMWKDITPTGHWRSTSGSTTARSTGGSGLPVSSPARDGAGSTYHENIPTGAATDLRMGFDRAFVPKTSAMSTWWQFSPYYDSGLYLCGKVTIDKKKKKHCEAVNKRYDPILGDPKLGRAWVSSVESYGWGLISIWVGPQAPCAIQKGLVSIKPKDPYSQGQAEAGKAIGAAQMLSSSLGPVIYYNMENYDTSNSACRGIVRAFLNGWINGMQAQTEKAGVYGNIAPAALDFSQLNPLPDDAWITWTPAPPNPPDVSIWGLVPKKGPGLCDPFSKTACKTPLWFTDQRIHQYLIDHNETWGGTSLSIDNDIVDAAVSVPSVRSKSYTFNYKSIDYPSAKLTNALGIDNAGDIVGYYYYAPNARHGFLDVQGQFTSIEYPNAAQTEAWGINDSGQIVGYYIDSNSNFFSFLVSYPYSDQDYSTISLGSGTFTVAFGINDDGQIVGYYQDSNGYHGFLDNTSNGVITTIDDGAGTLVRNINGDSYIVGLIQGGSSFLYDAVTKTFTPFGPTVDGVNDSLEMVGGNTLYDYKSGSQTPINYPGASGTGVFAVNDYAEIVGNWYDSSGVQHGFLATPKQQ